MAKYYHKFKAFFPFKIFKSVVCFHFYDLSEKFYCRDSILGCCFNRNLLHFSSTLYFTLYYKTFYGRNQWKGSNHKQSARWQHVSQLKASAFCIW
jgi:hypothetical protein